MKKTARLLITCLLLIRLITLDVWPASAPLTNHHFLASKYTQKSEMQSPKEVLLISYTVSGAKLTVDEKPKLKNADHQRLQSDTQKHMQIWGKVKQLIPVSYLSRIASYEVITDGKRGVAAAVVSADTYNKKWILAIDIADAFTKEGTLNTKELTDTIIHEFGHILTLSNEQLGTRIKGQDTYRADEGYTKSNSYLNLFYQSFWKELYKEWSAINDIEDDEEYFEALDSFYTRNQTKFVTDYAVTSPEEDIAESWMRFITAEKPQGKTIAQKKILFFYGFPELVKMREGIRSNIGKEAVTDGSKGESAPEKASPAFDKFLEMLRFQGFEEEDIENVAVLYGQMQSLAKQGKYMEAYKVWEQMMAFIAECYEVLEEAYEMEEYEEEEIEEDVEYEYRLSA